MGKEKRLYERLEFNCPCECAQLDSFPETFPATIVDIGPQGVGFVCEEQLKIGTSIYFSVNLGDGEPVKFIAKPRWTSKIANTNNIRYGAKILNASPDDLEKIARFYCKRLAPARREKKIILVIENDEEIIKLLEENLAASGFNVVLALNGDSGFAEYRSQRPDLIILAVKLPHIDGIEVRRKIRKLQDDRTTPILMLSVSEMEAKEHEEKYAKAQKFLVKPFKGDDLITAVKDLLDASHLSKLEKGD